MRFRAYPVRFPRNPRHNAAGRAAHRRPDEKPESGAGMGLSIFGVSPGGAPRIANADRFS